MPELNPEQLSRQQIDEQLRACGWIVQDYKAIDFSAGRGIAVREVPLKTGPCDYLLLVDRKALGVVEAKKVGTTLSTVADQSLRYASSLPDLLAAGAIGPLPFLYESTGVETFFRDSRQCWPREQPLIPDPGMVNTLKHTLTLLTALLLAPLAALHAADLASPAAWMPRAEDGTQLWWVEGSPKVFNSQVLPKDETLCFRYGGEKLLFDTKRVIIEELKFADAERREFSGRARLEITAWMDRLAFCLESDGEARLELRRGEKKVEGTKSMVLEVVNQPSTAAVESELPVTFDEALGCHRLALPEKPWSNANRTYYPEEHLDRVDRWRVTLRNDADTPTVARLMFTQQKHLPITGFTPMLCEPDGTPTGIPVQVSKNWHQRPEKGHLPHEGSWFHGFAWVRLPPKSKRDLVFQMVYVHYGGVCAASHAQLSLIGWGHNQFWDQAAATRGLIVRSWRAVLGGKPAAPHLATYCTEWGKGNHKTSVELAPPPGIAELQPGDFVEAELELVVFPADAAAYYGPNAALRDMLAHDADTWRPVHREAQGNTLKPQAHRGTIVKPYPLVVAVDNQQRARVTLQGGLGHLPMNVMGLTRPRGHRLIVNGKSAEHWQTDWNPTTQRWQVTYNVATVAGGSRELELENTR